MRKKGDGGIVVQVRRQNKPGSKSFTLHTKESPEQIRDKLVKLLSKA